MAVKVGYAGVRKDLVWRAKVGTSIQGTAFAIEDSFFIHFLFSVACAASLDTLELSNLAVLRLCIYSDLSGT